VVAAVEEPGAVLEVCLKAHPSMRNKSQKAPNEILGL